MNATTEPVGEAMTDAIAVVGMAGRFPGAPDVATFWRNLRGGVDSITRFTPAELRSAGVSEALLADPDYVRARGVLTDVEEFDAEFFGIAPQDAKLMDPQQRIFLECVWEALEDACCDPATFGGAIGLYAGSSVSTYYEEYLRGMPEAAQWSVRKRIVTGNEREYLAARAAHVLDLRGPCMTVHTASSTSLVAVHLACAGLREGECDTAVAGGVTIRVPHISGYLYEEGWLASPNGHCRAFDANAHGTVFGSGAGVVVLRRLEDALSDGDPVRAVIRGSAVNNDGASRAGFITPSQSGQARVIAEALGIAEVEPHTLGYVESHGMGTPHGDAIELAALKEVFGSVRTRGTCAVGSVKSNVGHLEAAAGVTGLIKTVLALHHREIPPTLHVQRPTAEVDLSGGPLYINTELRDWPEGDGPRRAGVSSFGIGGTNAHVVVEEAPRAAEAEPSLGESDIVLPLSAKSPAALRALSTAYADLLEAQEPASRLRDIAYTASVRRAHHRHRLAAVGRSGRELAQELRRTTLLPSAPVDSRRLVFVFPPLKAGTEDLSAGRQLLQQQPAFRSAVARVDHAIYQRIGWSLRHALASEPDSGELGQRSRLIAFSLQVALAETWRHWGVEPDTAVGDGGGRTVSRYLADLVSLDDVLPLLTDQADHAPDPWTPHQALGGHESGAAGSEDLEDALERSTAGSELLLLEIAVRPTLRTGLEAALQRLGHGRTINTWSSSDDAGGGLLRALAEVYEHGRDVDWKRVHTAGRCVSLPAYPWDRRRHWADAPS